MRTRRTKDQIRKDNYNKDVDAYNFYVVNLETMKAETGFEFKEDAVDLLNDYDDKKKYKVVSKRALKSMGVENPNEKFKYVSGGSLVGNQKRIDLNKNGKIDAEDFKLLRSSMNGAWRKEHKYVNSTSRKDGKVIDYEVNYARKNNPSRTGYKGKSNFEYGGNLPSWLRNKEGEMVEKGKYVILDERNFNENLGFPTRIDVYVNGLKIGFVQYDVEEEDWSSFANKKFSGGTNFPIKEFDNTKDAIKYIISNAPKSSYENGGKVDSKLTEKEVEKIAKETAKVLGSKFSVTKGSVDNGSFDLDYDGIEYDGGSYIVLENGDVKNVAVPESPIVYNHKTKMKYAFGGMFGGRTYSTGRAYTNDKKHVNHSEEHEVKYIKKHPNQKRHGYGGMKYNAGGSLENHGLKKGDRIIKTIDGGIQEVKDKDGNIVYVNLANGERSADIPLPFDNGGSLGTFSMEEFKKKQIASQREKEKGENFKKFKVNVYEQDKSGAYPFIDSLFTDNFAEAFNFAKIIIEKKRSYRGNSGVLWATIDKFTPIEDRMNVIYPYSEISRFTEEDLQKSKYDDGGEVTYFVNKDGIKVRSVAKPDKELSEKEWMAKHSETNEARAYAGGGKLTFKEKARAIAKNFVGKRVEPKYKKEYGKTYDAKEAKEVGNKIAGAQKASYDSKAESGAVVKKKSGNPKMKEAMVLAKKIRKDGEKWTDAVKRAYAQIK